MWSPYVNCLVLGDSIRNNLCPIWGNPSPCSSLFTNRMLIDKGYMIANIWNVPNSANPINRMFFQQKIDVCIILYDLVYRRESESDLSLATHRTQSLYFCQKDTHKIIIIIIDDKDETEQIATIRRLYNCYPDDSRRSARDGRGATNIHIIERSKVDQLRTIFIDSIKQIYDHRYRQAMNRLLTA